jgi:hypothetical protein
MRKREAYELGLDRGRNVASWVDMPELGTKIPRNIDWVGYDVVTGENLADVMELYAFASEENGRQYSPFEETASEFNRARNSESLWEAFDRGITDGIRQDITKRLKQ